MVGFGHRRIASAVTIDREEELALIERALDAAAAGTSGLVLVGGEAGIGKSRLVAEALERAERRRFHALRGECLAFGRDIPYLPFLEILRDLWRELPDASRQAILAPAVSELALLVPELANVTPKPRSRTARRPLVDDDTPGLARLRLFEALLRVAERLAADAPVVAAIEDLQWADQASLALLSYVIRGVSRSRVLLLVTMRTDELDAAGLAFLADLERDERVERVELTGLTAEHTGEQLASILGRRPERSVITRVHELSGGNPFYAEELLASERDPSPPQDDADTWPAVSPRLRDILRARVGRLPPAARSVLRVVATTDRTVDVRLLTLVSNLSEESLEEGLRAAVEEHLLVPITGPEGSGFRFRHELVRAFVASDALPIEAARLHAAFADHLASSPAAQGIPGELAYHRDAAGDDPRAFEAHVEAGLEAEWACAFEVAHRHLERALVLWDRVPHADDRVGLDRLDLARHTADSAARVGRTDRAIDLARAIIRDGGDAHADLIAAVRSRLRWYLWQAGRIDEAVAEAERAVTALARAGHDRWRANAIAHLAGLRLFIGDTVRARHGATEALALAQAEGAWEEVAFARGILGWCLVHAGRVDEGIDQIRAVWQTAHDQDVSNLTGTALAYQQLASALEFAGRAVEAADVAAEGAEWSARRGMERTFGRALEAVRARALYHIGRWAEAEATVTGALDLGPVGPGTLSLQAVRALLDAAHGHEMDVGGALSLAGSLEHSRYAEEPVGWLLAAVAEHALWQGDHETALVWLGMAPASEAHPGLSPAGAGVPSADPRLNDSSRPHRLALAARAIADTTMLARATHVDRVEATSAIESVIRAEIRRFGRRRALAAAWRPELLCAAAELQRARRPGSREEVRAWERVGTTAAGHGRPYVEAYARWRLAEALLAGRGARTRAATELGAGLSLATHLGAVSLAREMGLLATRARLQLAHETGDRETESTDAPIPFGLTGRELEVLHLLAAGDSNRAIGQKLFISPRTASVHVSNILGKMGVGGRVEAAAVAHRLGLAGVDRTPRDQPSSIAADAVSREATLT